MILSPSQLAASLSNPCRELKNTAPRRGTERSRRPARFSQSKFQHAGRGGAAASSALYTDDFARVRAIGIVGLKTVRTKSSLQARLPALIIRTASQLLPAGATPRASSVSSAPLRAFYSVWPLKAARRLIPLRFNSSQEPKRCIAQSLKSFSSVVSHAVKEQHEAKQWNEKVFPNLQKVLVKVT